VKRAAQNAGLVDGANADRRRCMTKDWDSYVPRDMREWDWCDACRDDKNHTVEQHIEIISEYKIKSLAEANALNEWARRVYGSDRDLD
jgi:hypothetical protein